MHRYGVVSADSHVVEPIEAFRAYISAAYKGRAPRIERREEHDVLVMEGLPPRHLGSHAVAGQDPKRMRTEGRYQEGIRGGWDPEARLLDMDTDGVEAEVLYPTLAFSVWRVPDPGLRAAIMDSYNRWLAHYCSVAPRRLIGLGLVAIHDAQVAARQIQEVSAMGLRGICIAAMAPEDKPFHRRDYEPIWAAAQDAGLPISLHVFTESTNRQESPDFMVRYAVVPSRIAETITTFISYGILERFPSLKLISVEVDVGWMANYLQRIDHAFERHRWRASTGLGLAMRPSDYFHRQVFGTFMDDRAGVLLRHQIGVNNMMWSSDYPHSDSTWPRSQEVIGRIFEGVPEGEKRRIVHDNVTELYGLAE